MSQTSDQMELRETEITAHYPMALAMLRGFDHAPRIGKAKSAPQQERSSGLGTRRRFRNTTPGPCDPAHRTRRGRATDGDDRRGDDDDALMSPVQATVLNTLRRAISISLAVARISRQSLVWATSSVPTSKVLCLPRARPNFPNFWRPRR